MGLKWDLKWDFEKLKNRLNQRKIPLPFCGITCSQNGIFFHMVKMFMKNCIGYCER